MSERINKMAEFAFNTFEFACDWDVVSLRLKEEFRASQSERKQAMGIAKRQWNHERKKAGVKAPWQKV